MKANTIAKKFSIDDKMEIMAQQQCFVTVKDHKEDFRSNPKFRLLNPTKSQLGKLSKHILQKINNEVRSNLTVNQWQNSSEVIECFFFFFFFYRGFLSRTFTIHRTAGEGGGYLFNSSLPLPPASQTLRH